MKYFLVTGGAGFIGSNLVKALANNNKVIVIDDLSSGYKSNIPKSNNIKFINADLTNFNLSSIKEITSLNSFLDLTSALKPNILVFTAFNSLIIFVDAESSDPYVKTTLQLSEANLFTIAEPIPLLPPVIKIVLP